MEAAAASLVHDALFYDGENEYVSALGEFVREGADRGEPTLVAVPEPRLGVLRSALHEAAPEAAFVDMREAGRNPARILPFIRAFIDSHPGQPVRFVGQPIWAGRTSEETVEGHRHEALINAAFAGSSAHIVCPYDVAALDATVVADARRTHPTLVRCGRRHESVGYADPLVVYAAEDRPLADPPGPAVGIELTPDLHAFRGRVEEYARSAGLEGERLSDFVLAAHEVAVNTVTHGGGAGRARIWSDPAGIVFELASAGEIRDPLVGRRMPALDQASGRGVWLMNQLCDLVELRSGPAGTVVRLHMSV